MDLSQIMKMAGQLREQMANAQSEAVKIRVTGEAGAGMVRVVMNGRYEVLETHIDPKAVDPTDLSLLEDLLRAAVNHATSQIGGQLQSQIGSMAQQFGIDPSNFGFGGDNKP